MDPEILKKIPSRNGGGRVEIGEGNEGGISHLIPLKNILITVTEKSIWGVQLADNVDPKRENPNIPNQLKEKVLDYGNNNVMVGRVFLQAHELFLSSHINIEENDKKELMEISLNFLKELVAMYEKIKELENEHNSINEEFKGELSEDGSLSIPKINHLERRIKEILQNIDHLNGFIMKTISLFLTESNKRKLVSDLVDQIYEKYTKKHEISNSAKSVKENMQFLRDIRNDMEHPEGEGTVTIRNYSMNKSGEVEVPKILHSRDSSPFKEMSILNFISQSHSDVISFYEIITVLLADLHSKKFAGNNVLVEFIPNELRKENNKYMNYRYSVAWIK
jgi:hypothetical protein